MANKVDIVETERLFLRGIDHTDTDSIVLWRSEPEVYKYFKNPHKITKDEHNYWYSNIYLNNEKRFDWMCIEKKSKAKIGVFGLLLNGEGSAEISYILSLESRHKGYATECAQRIIDYAHQTLNIKKIIAEIHEDNYQSINFIKRLGFRLESANNNFQIYEKEVN